MFKNVTRGLTVFSTLVPEKLATRLYPRAVAPNVKTVSFELIFRVRSIYRVPRSSATRVKKKSVEESSRSSGRGAEEALEKH